MNAENNILELNPRSNMEEETKENIIPKDEKKDTMENIFTFFVKQFSKAFAVRSVYTLVTYLSSIRKKKFSLISLFKEIIALPNIRTSLFFSLMPSLNRLFNLELSKLNTGLDVRVLTFIAGFTSGLIGILIEEKTELVNFVIFSVLSRVLHILINISMNQFKIDFGGKKSSFLCFLLVSIVFILLSYYHPTFKSIKKIVDSYANFVDENEIKEIEFKRNAMRLV